MGSVTRLPTAARRKVQQRYNRFTRAARQQMRRDEPWPGVYVDPQVREAMKLAADLREIEQTPALLIVSAMVAALDEDARLRIVMALAPGAAAGRTAHRQAVAAVRASRLTIGQEYDLTRAFDILDRERR